jgi:hypothetical protein
VHMNNILLCGSKYNVVRIRAGSSVRETLNMCRINAGTISGAVRTGDSRRGEDYDMNSPPVPWIMHHHISFHRPRLHILGCSGLHAENIVFLAPTSSRAGPSTVAAGL